MFWLRYYVHVWVSYALLSMRILPIFNRVFHTQLKQTKNTRREVTMASNQVIVTGTENLFFILLWRGCTVCAKWMDLFIYYTFALKSKSNSIYSYLFNPHKPEDNDSRSVSQISFPLFPPFQSAQAGRQWQAECNPVPIQFIPTFSIRTSRNVS